MDASIPMLDLDKSTNSVHFYNTNKTRNVEIVRMGFYSNFGGRNG